MVSESFGFTGPYVSEQFGILWNYMELFFSLDISPLFSSNEGGNK